MRRWDPSTALVRLAILAILATYVSNATQLWTAEVVMSRTSPVEVTTYTSCKLTASPHLLFELRRVVHVCSPIRFNWTIQLVGNPGHAGTRAIVACQSPRKYDGLPGEFYSTILRGQFLH